MRCLLSSQYSAVRRRLVGFAYEKFSLLLGGKSYIEALVLILQICEKMQKNYGNLQFLAKNP